MLSDVEVVETVAASLKLVVVVVVRMVHCEVQMTPSELGILVYFVPSLVMALAGHRLGCAVHSSVGYVRYPRIVHM